MHRISSGPRVVLFDLDGTLVDSVELIVRCFQHTTAYHLGAPLERTTIVATIGRPLRACLEEIAPGRGEALYATYREFNNAQHDLLIQPIAGMLSVLPVLRGWGYPLGVVTSKTRVGAEAALARFELGAVLDTVVCLEDTIQHKPEPEPLLCAARRLGVAPEQALYVGDSTFDVRSAQAASMPVAAVLWGAGKEADLHALRPTYLLSDPAELLELLRPAPRDSGETPVVGRSAGHALQF